MGHATISPPAKMMKRIHKLLHLPSVDRRLLINAVILVGSIRLGLWLLPFKGVLRMLQAERKKNPEHPNANPAAPLERYIWSVKVASRYVPAATCLTQALAAKTLLARKGYPADLRIGVLKTKEGKFEAHAWLESDGKIVIGDLPDLARYSALPSLRNAVS
jgi:hypothetical protein